MPIIINPPTNTISATINGISIPVSIIVVKKRPGGVFHEETKLFPAKMIIGNHHIVPMKDKNPPIKTRFMHGSPFIKYSLLRYFPKYG